MYSMADKATYIKKIQRKLLILGDAYAEIPRVSVDGIYGDETRAAIYALQNMVGISKNGVLDYETFLALELHHLELRNRRSASNYIINDTGFPLTKGEQNKDVLILNLIIDELRKTYKEIGSVNLGSYFNANTENAVKNLQNIFMMEETGVVDSLLFDRLVIELNSQNASSNFRK